ncbi:UrcA family protein [Erythrobacter sp. HL-111]|uniref:UrcA family protein n=1 Tax=Erythrobacter sp. HL-111 TaxID=1798193 RepID=UPI0006DBC034|nr:UrcA family protein [Erythrobacter sp. HL-111]KPP94442.1 MAG: UrcA family protein [Erythrobacteraceae bacterium HL-111]SDS57162.1 UrcA family protein [Erythrobacter sp. HL-111]
MFNRIITLALAAAIAGAATLPAAAQAAEPATAKVALADLDLTTKAGRDALDRRIDRAARKVCGGQPDLRNLGAFGAFRKCVDTARAGTEEQVRVALDAANARRVAMIADKLGVVSIF